MSPKWSGKIKVKGAGHTQHHLSHSKEVAWPGLGTLSLPADGDPLGPAALPGCSPDSVFLLCPVHPRLPPGAKQAERPLSLSWPAPGLLAGVGRAAGRVLGLGLWGDGGGCGPALASPPTSLPLGLGLSRPRPASGHRTGTFPHRADAPHPSRPE